jgi:hypothetical protein
VSAVLSYARRQARDLLAWLRARPAPRGTSLVMAWAGVILGLVAADAVLLPIGPVPTLLILLLFACFGPGAALVCQVRLGDPVAALALVLVLSLSTFAVVSGLMVWLRIWYPTTGVVVLGLITAVLSAAELAPLTDARNRRSQPASSPAPSTSPLRTAPAAGPRIPAQRGVPAAEKHPLSEPVPSDQPGVPAAEKHPVPSDQQSPAVPHADGSANATQRALPMPKPRTSPEVTAVLPKIADNPDATAVIPKVMDDPGSTTVLPKVVDDAGSTTVLPKVVDDPGSTTVLPKMVDDPASTAVLPRITEGAVAEAADRDGPAPDRWRRFARLLGDLAPMAVVVVLWLFALSRTSTAGVDSYGLLFVMHPTFFVAIGVCVAGFLVELSRRTWRGWVLIGYLVLLVLLMHATVPLLDSAPEYPWVYKHLGVVDFIRVHGEVTDSADIYQQWPTFFAAVAQLVAASGIDPLRVAAWAPPFFDLANCLPVFAIARTLTDNRRVPFLTAFVFTAMNWIEQDYLSPQAFAYLLSLGALMILLRWLRRAPSAKRVRWRLLRRLQSWVQAGLPDMPYTSARTERASLIALYVVYGTIVISHQISPYIVAASATALVVLGLIQPWRVVPILMGIAVAYAAPRYSVVDSYGALSGFDFFSNAKGLNHASGQLAAGGVFSHKVVMTLVLTVWGSVGVILLAARRRLGPLAVPGVLAFAPMAILIGQNYGGEAVYRVFLFSAPWCSYLITGAVLRIRLPSRLWRVRLPLPALRVAVATPVLAATALAAMQGEHGQFVFEQLTPDEVTGSLYLYNHVTNGSWVIDALGNSPDRLTAKYAEINQGANASLLPSLDGGPVKVSAAMDAKDIAGINGYFQDHARRPEYLVITSSMEHYADFFGYLPPGTLDRLNTALTASPRWTVFWASAHMRVYKFVPEPDSP